jgi:iron complex transport system permease protein
VAWLLLQTFFNNPIVEPYVLGISSGSMLFVGITMLAGVRLGVMNMSPGVMAAGAFAGAMLVMCLVMFASRKVRSMITLLIIGLMFGYVSGAGVSILSAFAEKEQIARFHLWSMGSFAGFSPRNVRTLYVVAAPCLAASLLLAKPLNALGLGETYAASMGINVRASRTAIIILSSILTAITVAFAGPVSFIGLAVPHIMRVLFRTSNNRILMPACILGGAIMAGFCDFIARTIISPVELPLGAITAVIGAPIVVALLLGKDMQ